MTTSVSTRASSPLPAHPAPVFRRRLEAVRDRLAGLEARCPAGHAAALADVLEFIEDELISLGWEPPPPPPFTDRDKAVLAAAGAL